MPQDYTSNNPIQTNEPNDEIDLLRLIHLLLGKWYWLLPCIIIGIVCAFFYIKYTPGKYKVDTSLIVTNNSKGSSIENIFMDNIMPGMQKLSLQNEVELLQSYNLNYKAIDNLNWQTIWQEKDLFVWNSLYLNEPFIINTLENAINPSGIQLYIIPISDSQYKIKANGEVTVDKKPIDIDFEEIASYGQTFKNKYFDFTLHLKDKNTDILNSEYRFSFIDKSKTTFNYQKRTATNFTKDSEVLKLSLESSDPMRDIHFINELVRVYLELKLDIQTQAQKRSLNFIDSQLSGISESLSVAENNFTEFRSKNQIIDLSNQGSLIMEQLKEIEHEKTQMQMQLDYYKNLQQYIGNIQSADQLITPSVVGITDATLNALVLKLSELYSKRQILSYSAHANNPTLILLNQEIEQTNHQLREILVNLIDNTQLSVETLGQRYTRINSQLNNMPQQEQQLLNIQRQYELTNEIYTFLLERRAELEITLAGAVVDIQIIDSAQYERLISIKQSPLLILFIGAFLGLILPVLLILMFDFFNNKIHVQEDVERLTPLTVLGNVFHSKSNTELIVTTEPTSPIAESYRTIRTNLQYKFAQGEQKIIGLHSVQPSEGKTFNSTNLSSILAMNDKKTVLIGADMRKPRLHQIFNLPNLVGLSSYLAGQASAEEIVQKTEIDNLSVIPSGPIPPNPAELLERKAFTQLLEKLKKEFDYIIIDNAPVSRVTDGLITSKETDLNLFVLRCGVSKKDQMKFINGIAKQGVMKNPALIINDIKLSSIGYGYSSSYKYGYSEGYS